MSDKSEKIMRSIGKSPQFRAFHMEQSAVDLENRTVDLAFSSEAEYERSFGIEVLDHSPGSIRLDRMKAGAALLLNHNWDDQIGAMKGVEIGDDRKARSRALFSRSARADEILQDVADGIRTQVSVGYFVHKMVLDRKGDDKSPDVYRVTDWEPFEVSIVSVPADTTVGVGRQAEIEVETELATEPEPEKDEITMSDEIKTPEVDVKAIEADAAAKARKAELDRIRGIDRLADKHGLTDLGNEFKNSDRSLDEFRAAVLEKMGKATKVQDSPEIGLTKREAQNFSFVRAIRAMANPGDRAAQEAAAFERECSAAAELQTKRSSQGIMVPYDALTRDLTVGTAADGGNLVGTDHLGASFIEMLRNRMMVLQMGAREMGSLVGDIAVPTQTGASTAYWVAESTAPTEGKQAFGQKTATPHCIGAFTDISRKLILQSSPAVEGLVRSDLAAILGLGIDLAALHGTGTNEQPQGLAAAGIDTTSVAGGTNGLAPTWAHMVGLETAVAQDNADVGTLGYLTNAKVRGKLKGVFKNATYGLDPVWADGNEPGFGMVNGYRAGVSNQVSSTLTKGSASGVCSAVFFGDWSNLLVCMWGSLDLTVDPYSLSSQGALRVVALQDVDILVRHVESFSAMLDALTT